VVVIGGRCWLCRWLAGGCPGQSAPDAARCSHLVMWFEDLLPLWPCARFGLSPANMAQRDAVPREFGCVTPARRRHGAASPITIGREPGQKKKGGEALRRRTPTLLSTAHDSRVP